MAMAEELGAVFSPHLTQECTHVLARAWNSAKCKCAAELGRPVLLPDWILACYNNRKNAGYNFKAVGFRLGVGLAQLGLLVLNYRLSSM